MQEGREGEEEMVLIVGEARGLMVDEGWKQLEERLERLSELLEDCWAVETKLGHLMEPAMHRLLRGEEDLKIVR